MSEIEPFAGAGVEIAESLHVVGDTMAPGAGSDEPLPPPLETSGARAWPPSRVLAILVVATTLVAASVGYLLNRAAAAASENNGRAQQVGLQASAADTAATQGAENDYSLYLTDTALRAKAGQEMLEAGLASSDPTQWAADFAATSAQEAQAAERIPPDVRPLLSDGDPDPNFPSDLIARRTAGATALAADSSAYNDAGQKWSSLVTTYTVLLTLLAVALFLFGSGFGLFGVNRLLFTGIGLTLLVTTAVWGGAATVVQQPAAQTTSACSVAAGKVVTVSSCSYAQGQVQLSKAVAPPDYQSAIDDFSAAIAARPDYAQAYQARAGAEWLRGSEEIGTGFVSNVDPYWAQRSAADDLRAYDLGDHDANVAGDAGFDAYQLWLMPHSSQCATCGGGSGSPPSQAMKLSSEAATLDPTNPVAWMNLGVVSLAARDYGSAVHAYATAAAHILYADIAHRTAQPSSNHGRQKAWVAGGMTDLGGLANSSTARQDATLRGQIATMEGVLTGSLATGSVVSGPSWPPVTFSQDDLSDYIDPNFVSLFANVPSGASESALAAQPVTVLWYERVGNGAMWNAIAEATRSGKLSDFYSPDFKNFTFVDAFLQDASSCFPPRQYKAEIYLGGALAGSLSTGPDAGDVNYAVTSDLTPGLALGMNVGACVPADWHMRQPDPVRVTVSGTSQQLTGELPEMHWTSADGSSGIYALRLYAPHGTYIGDGSAAQDEAASMAIAVAGPGGLLAGHGLPEHLLQHPGNPDGFDNCDRGGNDSILRGAGFIRQNCSWMGLTDSEEGAFIDPSTNMEALVGVGVLTPADSLPPDPADQDAGSNGIASSVANDDAFIVMIVYGPAGGDLWTGSVPPGLQIERSASLLNFG